MRAFALFTIIAACLAPAVCLTYASPKVQAQSEITGVSDVSSIAPGKPFTLALRITMEEGWHTYWVNPGDSGFPLSVNWKLPAGFKAGELRFPVPMKMVEEGATSFGFEGETTVLVTITPPKTLKVGSKVTLGGDARWLVCAKECLPANGKISLTLPVAKAAIPNAGVAAAFTKARAGLPAAAPIGWGLRAERLPNKDFNLELRGPAHVDISEEGWDFYPLSSEVSYSKPVRAKMKDGVLNLSLPFSGTEDRPATRVRGILVAPRSIGGLSRWTSIDIAVNR